MPKFVIETTYMLPVYRQHVYEAESFNQACQMAIDDDDWEDQKQDYDGSGAIFVSRAIVGDDIDDLYTDESELLDIPKQYQELETENDPNRA